MIPTKKEFDVLMTWLGANGEDPGEKYEHIRLGLVKLFMWNGCSDAEDWADKTIDRVAKKVPELINNYSGDPALYFYGVGKMLVKEWRRQYANRESQALEWRLIAINPDKEDFDETERKFECLEKCIGELPRESRALIIDYYRGDKRAKIDFRREIAKRMGMEVENLRVKVFRIRGSLFKCMENCIGTTALVQ